MRCRWLVLCLSIFVLTFAGCSTSQRSAEEEARLEAEQSRLADQAKLVSEQAEAANQALATAEQAKAAAEEALAAAKKANSAEQARSAAEAKAKADAEHAKAAEQAKAAADAKAKAEAEAEAARAAAKQARREARQEARTITLAAGTPIKVITSSEISTKTNTTGEVFTAILNEDISDGDRVIAKRGATVKGSILESDPGGRVKGVAMLSLTLTNLTLADNNEVTVTTDAHQVEAKSSVGKDVAKTGIGAGIGAAIGAIAGGGKGAAIGAGIGGAAGATAALATRGDPAVVAPETEIIFNLSAPLTVTLRQDGDGRRR